MKVPGVPGVELRPIPGIVGYAAGSDGWVYSFVRPAAARNRMPKYQMTPRRVGSLHRAVGRRYTGVAWTGKREPTSRLIAAAFHGPCPDGMEVSHLNGDALDDRPGNLKWESHADNLRRMEGHGTRRIPRVRRGESNNKTKLTEDQVLEIRREVSALRASSTARDGRAPTGSILSLARRFGVSKTNILDIAKGTTWGHLED